MYKTSEKEYIIIEYTEKDHFFAYIDIPQIPLSFWHLIQKRF